MMDLSIRSLKRAFKNRSVLSCGQNEVQAAAWGMLTLICDLSCCIQDCQQSALACVLAPQGFILTDCSDPLQSFLFPPSLPSLPPLYLSQWAHTWSQSKRLVGDDGQRQLQWKHKTFKHTHTHTHRLFIEGATRAVEQINDLTSQLAHSAREEMALTGLLLSFFSVYCCTLGACGGSLWSNSKVFSSALWQLPAGLCSSHVALTSCLCKSSSVLEVCEGWGGWKCTL